MRFAPLHLLPSAMGMRGCGRRKILRTRVHAVARRIATVANASFAKQAPPPDRVRKASAWKAYSGFVVTRLADQTGGDCFGASARIDRCGKAVPPKTKRACPRGVSMVLIKRLAGAAYHTNLAGFAAIAQCA